MSSQGAPEQAVEILLGAAAAALRDDWPRRRPPRRLVAFARSATTAIARKVPPRMGLREKGPAPSLQGSAVVPHGTTFALRLGPGPFSRKRGSRRVFQPPARLATADACQRPGFDVPVVNQVGLASSSAPAPKSARIAPRHWASTAIPRHGLPTNRVRRSRPGSPARRGRRGPGRACPVCAARHRGAVRDETRVRLQDWGMA